MKRVIRLEKNGPDGSGLSKMDLSPSDFHGPVPIQTVHSYYNDDEIGLNVGVWTTTNMQEAFGPYPGDEFIWLLEGGFSMVDEDGQALDHYEEGESVFFRNGAPVSWMQKEFLRKFYITYLNPDNKPPVNVEALGAVKAVDGSITQDQMTTLETTDPFTIEGEKPIQNDYNHFTNDTEDMFVGTWDSTPFQSKMEAFPVYEFVQLLEGEITITEEDGTVHIFKSNDCFFIPKGTVCSWKTTEYVKKYYAMLTPES